jgi:hypothetical protein
MTKINVGTIDRVVRILVGLALIGLATTGNIGVWGWLGALLLVTAFLKMCPLYTVLGIKTCSN